MWRKSVTSYVKTETTYRMRPSIRNILQPTRNLYDFRSKVMVQKVIFMYLDMFDLDLDISRSLDFWEFTICYRARLV